MLLQDLHIIHVCMLYKLNVGNSPEFLPDLRNRHNTSQYTTDYQYPTNHNISQCTTDYRYPTNHNIS